MLCNPWRLGGRLKVLLTLREFSHAFQIRSDTIRSLEVVILPEALGVMNKSTRKKSYDSIFVGVERLLVHGERRPIQVTTDDGMQMHEATPRDTS
jgi:hypothetical protein